MAILIILVIVACVVGEVLEPVFGLIHFHLAMYRCQSSYLMNSRGVNKITNKGNVRSIGYGSLALVRH